MEIIIRQLLREILYSPPYSPFCSGRYLRDKDTEAREPQVFGYVLGIIIDPYSYCPVIGILIVVSYVTVTARFNLPRMHLVAYQQARCGKIYISVTI